MMTMGISLALVVAFVVIPAGMMLFGKGANAADKDNSVAITSKFSWFTEHYGSVVLVAALLLGMLSA